MLNRLQDVFASLNRYNVRYVVIGGIAVVLHGVPRATFDLDLLIDASPDNARRLIDALLAAGLGTAALTSADEILANEITVFKDRVRIDVQTSTPGLSFADAWAHRLSMNYQGQPFHIVSREDLILGETRGRPAGRSGGRATPRSTKRRQGPDHQRSGVTAGGLQLSPSAPRTSAAR